MKDRLFPILLTLTILCIIFGGWFIGKEKGWFIKNSINDVSICRTIDGDTIYIDSKNTMYTITGWEAQQHNDDILHIKVRFSRGYGGNITLDIDTLKTHYLEIFGQTLRLKDIPVCK